MATSSMCLRVINIFTAVWLTHLIHGLPNDTKLDCTRGTTLQLGYIDEGYSGDIEVIFSATGPKLELKSLCAKCLPFLELIHLNRSSIGISTPAHSILRTKKPLDAEALKEVTNSRTLTIRDVNDNAPVFIKREYRAEITEGNNGEYYYMMAYSQPTFQKKLYTAEIYIFTPPKSPVVKVQAIRDYVFPTEVPPPRLTYTLLKPNAHFAVDPLSGVVYVVTPPAESGTVILNIMAIDEFGRNDTTIVKVTIKDTGCVYVAVISLNQDIETVLSKFKEVKEALERALGWSVNIISVSRCLAGLARGQKHTSPSKLARHAAAITAKTYISFTATHYSGTTVIPVETIREKLRREDDKVQREFRNVFGSRAQVDVVEEEPNGHNVTTNVLLATLIALICIGGAIGAFFVYRVKKHRKSQACGGTNGEGVELITTPTEGHHGPNVLSDNGSLDGCRPNRSDDGSMDGRQPNQTDSGSINDGHRPNMTIKGSNSGRTANQSDSGSIDRHRPNLSDSDSMGGGRPNLSNSGSMGDGRPNLSIQGC